MENVILVIHLILAVSIIGLVLLQRSEGGGLGSLGGGGGGLGGLTTAKGAASALTKATAYCAAGFFCTSLLLGILAGQGSGARKGILEGYQDAPAAAVQPAAMDSAPEAPAPEAPATVPVPAPEAPMAQ